MDRLRLLYAKAPVRDIPESAGTEKTSPEKGCTGSPNATTAGGRASCPPRGTEPRPPDLSDELLALILDRTFLDDRPPIRQQTDFEARLAASRSRLQPTATEVTRLAAEILAAYQSLRQRLAAITQVNWQPTAQDLRDQLDALVFRGFFQQIPYVRLMQYPRYLKAAEQRLDKLAHAPGRDREQMTVMAELHERWRERTAAARKAGREDARLDEIRWLLEELRVSLFAQTLGTAGPVSVKRIEARWRELGL
jgi:ATP-dependent helicase HrpA